MTWSKGPSRGSKITTTSITAAGGYVDFDVTPYVAAHVASSDVLVTIWIEADSQDYQQVKFDSRRDDQPNKPKLHVASPVAGATFDAIVEVDIAVAGTVDAFDEAAFKQGLRTNSRPSLRSFLTVSAGSVALTVQLIYDGVGVAELARQAIASTDSATMTAVWFNATFHVESVSVPSLSTSLPQCRSSRPVSVPVQSHCSLL